MCKKKKINCTKYIILKFNNIKHVFSNIIIIIINEAIHDELDVCLTKNTDRSDCDVLKKNSIYSAASIKSGQENNCSVEERCFLSQ
jgi:hypothetical protein